jgi:MoaA/NifB/PqqE/SkfB family radical SAM enzyme
LLVVLEGFRSIKASLGTTKPEIQVNYTIFDRNAAELPLFIKKYHHLFQQLNIGNLIKTDERVPYHRLPPKEFDLAVQNARKLGQDLGIMVTAVYYRKKNDGRRARCFQPYYYRNIDSRGDLRVCSGAVIGNLLHDDHAAIMSAKKEYLSDLAALSDQACLNCW